MRLLLLASLLLCAALSAACDGDDDYGQDLACAAGPRDMMCGATTD